MTAKSSPQFGEKPRAATPMRSDIEIAQAATMQRIAKVARGKLGIPEDHLAVAPGTA